MTETVSRVLWYPTQAKKRLEWGTQRLLTMKQSKKVTTSQDDDSLGVLKKNPLNNLALIGLRPVCFQPSLREWGGRVVGFILEPELCQAFASVLFEVCHQAFIR